MNLPMLDIDHLSVSYGKVEAVREVSLKMQPGTIVTVIGSNKRVMCTARSPRRIDVLGRFFSNLPVKRRSTKCNLSFSVCRRRFSPDFRLTKAMRSVA